MTAPREHDEFERISLTSRMERDRLLIRQYEEGLTFHRARVEQTRYDLGRLDERLETRED